MKAKGMLPGLLSCAGMLLLILDSKNSFSAASDAVGLCMRMIIPSIFPFLVLSIFINGSLAGIQVPFLKAAASAMGLPKGTESILISSFLGGYPAGAQAVTQYYEAGILTKETAEKMLAFTNNAGPAFIFGIISHMFSQKWVPWALWIIHILSAFFVSQFMNLPSAPVVLSHKKTESGTMAKAINVTASICGWVIIFRIINDSILRSLPRTTPSIITVLITGILELSNGCLALEHVKDFSLRFLICSAMLSFGGLCVALQTISVCKGLSIRYYLAGKAIQLMISILIGILFLWVEWTAFPFLFSAALIIFRIKNKCGNKALLRV